MNTAICLILKPLTCHFTSSLTRHVTLKSSFTLTDARRRSFHNGLSNKCQTFWGFRVFVLTFEPGAFNHVEWPSSVDGVHSAVVEYSRRLHVRVFRGRCVVVLWKLDELHLMKLMWYDWKCWDDVNPLKLLFLPQVVDIVRQRKRSSNTLLKYVKVVKEKSFSVFWFKFKRSG